MSDEFNENALDGKKWDNGESSSNAVARGSRSVRKAPSIRSRPDGKGRVTVAVQNTKNYSAKPTPDRHRAFVIPFVADYVIEWDALNHPVPFDEKDALYNIVGPHVYADLYQKMRPLTPQPLYVNEDTFNPRGCYGWSNLTAEKDGRTATLTVKHALSGGKPTIMLP